MAFPLQRSCVVELCWSGSFRASGRVLVLFSLRTKHPLHRSWAIKAPKTVQVSNTTPTAAWEMMCPSGAVEYAQTYGLFSNVPVRALLLPPAEKNICHRPFPPKLYSLQEIESVLFQRIYLCLTVITKGWVFPLSLVTQQGPLLSVLSLSLTELWTFSPFPLVSAGLQVKIPYRRWALRWVCSFQIYWAPCAGFPVFKNPHCLVQVPGEGVLMWKRLSNTTVNAANFSHYLFCCVSPYIEQGIPLVRGKIPTVGAEKEQCHCSIPKDCM